MEMPEQLNSVEAWTFMQELDSARDKVINLCRLGSAESRQQKITADPVAREARQLIMLDFSDDTFGRRLGGRKLSPVGER
jgi:hypothetical protein